MVGEDAPIRGLPTRGTEGKMKVTNENRQEIEELSDRLADAVQCLELAEFAAKSLGAELFFKSAHAKRRSTAKLVAMIDDKLAAFDKRGHDVLLMAQRAADKVMNEDFVRAIESALTDGAPVATCGDCGVRFVWTHTELDAEVCDACAAVVSA